MTRSAGVDAGEPRPFSELGDEGLLWLINRVVFHPRGYALAFHRARDGTILGWSMLGDGSEIWAFKIDSDNEEFAKVVRFFGSIRKEEM